MGDEVPVSRDRETSPKEMPLSVVPVSFTVVSGPASFTGFPASGASPLAPHAAMPPAASATTTAPIAQLIFFITSPRRHWARERRRVPAEVVEVDRRVHQAVALVEDDEAQRERLARRDRRGRL